MRIFTRALLLLLLALPLLQPAAVDAETQKSLFSLVVADPAFSPNGDGRKDKFHISFTVRRPARVHVRKYGPDGVETVNLGRLGIGRHAWTWDGKGLDGHTWPDGTYGVELVGRRGDKVSKDYYNVDLLTHPGGRLATTRPVVYPLATTVRDHVRLVFVAQDYSPWNEYYWGVPQERARLRILDDSGHQVFTALETDVYTPRFTWAARDTATKAALPQGTYVARLRMVDWAGNVQRFSTPLRVSHLDLVEEVWKTVLPAASVGTYPPFWDGCNGCGDVCSPVPSERFSGGLSFRHPCPDSWPYASARFFAADVPFAAAPVDRYRVSLSGGPTIMGAADQAKLVVAESTTTLAAGEGTVTSPWSPVDLVHQPNLPRLNRPMVWSVWASEASYDVATFTLEYSHYVPAR